MKPATLLPIIASFTWAGLWFSPDQQGQRLMNRGDFNAAAEAFRDPTRKGIAQYRAGDFARAEQSFARVSSAEASYNRGICLILLGKYEAAIKQFDAALAERPDWNDAIVNRGIAEARAQLVEAKGGDLGDQQIGADEIKFDKNKREGGQETVIDGQKVGDDAAMQALWLRRVQTKPADFLKAKFAYQLADQQGGE